MLELMWRTTVQSILPSAVASGAITVAVMPRLVKRLRAQSRFDVPNSRSSHALPTPRGGGLACAAGVAAGVASARLVGIPVPTPVLTGVAALTVVGHLDDRSGLPPLLRLGAQVFTGALCGGFLGRSVSAAALGMAVVPAAVNSFNFMDGIDGISAGQVIVWTTSAVPVLLTHGYRGEAALASGAFAASLAFLPWNVPSARVFLGDVGSYCFGSIIALAWLSPAIHDWKIGLQLAAPMLVYFADTGSTLVRRLSNGDRITEAHRDHTYQRLVDLDYFSHWHVAAFVSVSSGVAAYLGRRLRLASALPLLIGAYLSLPAVARTLL